MKRKKPHDNNGKPKEEGITVNGVVAEITPYDLTRGRITYRNK